ncbi:hypothetical protein Mapa_015423 [Marchantia paleacea]|nr:hypothetical protein Mapa_015423 [Marchantia paleacea]
MIVGQTARFGTVRIFLQFEVPFSFFHCLGENTIGAEEIQYSLEILGTGRVFSIGGHMLTDLFS